MKGPAPSLARKATPGSGKGGRFYVQPDEVSFAVSGHLWWTRWSPPEEFVILWTEAPEGYDTDTWILPDDMTDQLDDWDRGQFRYMDATFDLTWLDDATTLAMRRAHVGDV